MRGRQSGLLALLVLCLLLPAAAATAQAPELLAGRAFLPLVSASAPSSCQPLPGATYNTLSVLPPPTDRPAEQHADLNLALRGYTPTSAYLGLVDYGGPTDPAAPQLPGLFADNRTGAFVRVQRVYDWNWACNCRGAPLANPPVTLAELAVTPGETLHVPDSGYTIGSGYEVVVLYAAPDRLTLKYTRNDNVVHGFTLHLENLCVDAPLLSLYQRWNAAGRSQFGRPIGEKQSIQWLIANTATEVEALRSLVYRTAWMVDTHQPYTKEAAMCKLYGSEVASRAVDRALQVHGALGYDRDFPLERNWRDARIAEIFEGTNEIQRIVIAGQVLRPYGVRVAP